MYKLTRNFIAAFLIVVFLTGFFLGGSAARTSKDVIYYASGEDQTIQGQVMKIDDGRQAAPLSTFLVGTFVGALVTGVSFVVLGRINKRVPQRQRSKTKKQRSPRALTPAPIAPTNYLTEVTSNATHTRHVPESQISGSGYRSG